MATPAPPSPSPEPPAGPAMAVTVTSGEGVWRAACADHAGAPRFLGEIAALAGDRGSLLLAGLAKALEDEVYDAAARLFEWLARGDGSGLSARCERTEGGWLLLLAAGDDAEAPDERTAMVGALLSHCIAARCDDRLRRPFVQALGLALSRRLGSGGAYAEAKAHVDAALGAAPNSIHLKAAHYALTLRLGGSPVPPRLRKFIGEDDGALAERTCAAPFTRFDIGPSGEVLVCCGHWLPTPIGSIKTDTVDDILNSPKALAIRRSVMDGTFKYCNHLDCGFMVRDMLPEKRDIDDERMLGAVATRDYRVAAVDQILFAFDQSCNLACPSCRAERIVERPSDDAMKVMAVETKLMPLLRSLKVLNINPAGEMLVSKSSRRILEMVDRESCPDLALELISNGTLFTKREWEHFANIHGMVRSLRISVDACTKEVFEKLRRYGDFEAFVSNMTFLGRLRAAGEIPQLKFSFTYQIDNFREMKDFVYFARGFNCDFVVFERLQNLGTFSDAEFRRRAVHRRDHPLNGEFLDIIRDPLFGEVCVWHDFELAECGHAPIPPERRARWLDESLTHPLPPRVRGSDA